MSIRAWLARLLAGMTPAESSRAHARDQAMALATGRTIAADDVAAAWPNIIYGLTHQGEPRDNLAKMIEVLERRTGYGWDEMYIGVADDDPAVAEVTFLGDERRCGTGALLAELRALAAEMASLRPS